MSYEFFFSEVRVKMFDLRDFFKSFDLQYTNTGEPGCHKSWADAQVSNNARAMPESEDPGVHGGPAYSHRYYWWVGTRIYLFYLNKNTNGGPQQKKKKKNISIQFVLFNCVSFSHLISSN